MRRRTKQSVLRVQLEELRQEWERERAGKDAVIDDLRRCLGTERAASDTELNRTIAERDASAAEAARWFEAAIAITADHNPLIVRTSDSRLRWWGNFMRLFAGSRRRRISPIVLAGRACADGRWELAARYYRDALDLEPNEARIWFQCGYALRAAGKVSEAEAAFRKAFEQSGLRLPLVGSRAILGAPSDAAPELILLSQSSASALPVT